MTRGDNGLQKWCEASTQQHDHIQKVAKHSTDGANMAHRVFAGTYYNTYSVYYVCEARPWAFTRTIFLDGAVAIGEMGNWAIRTP